MAPRLPEMPVCKPGKSAVETCCSKLEQLPDFENAPWSREDPRKGVCDLGQGGYYWPIWGKLPLKTCDEGWVIQHIRMTMNVVLQDGTKMTKIRVQDQILDLPSDISFWEAWRFGAYSQTSERYGVMSDDTYKWSSCPGSTGNIIIMGYAKFVPGPLPSHFKGTGEEGSVPYAGWLAHSTYRKPNGWNDRSCVEHFLTCDWDKYTSKVIGRFGSTTLVGQQVPNPPNPH